jgi:hypothetical protein
MRPSALVLFAALLAGCRKGDIAIGGTFRDIAAGTDSTLSVWAVEAQREAPVKRGEFQLEGLVPGPVSLEVRAGGRPVGRIDVPDLPAGAALTLQGLRVDPVSGRVFPADVALRGADRVTVNGVRMAPNARLPHDVDARGTVLALSGGADAFLLRPADSTAADLRVVVVPSTRAATRDGAPAELSAITRGDSVRVKGSTQGGYVIAAAIELPSARGGATQAASESGSNGSTGDGDEESGTSSGSETSAPAPMLGRSSAPAPPPAVATQGRGHGKGRGHAKKRGWF